MRRIHGDILQLEIQKDFCVYTVLKRNSFHKISLILFVYLTWDPVKQYNVFPLCFKYRRHFSPNWLSIDTCGSPDRS